MTGDLRIALVEPELEGFAVRDATVHEGLSTPWTATVTLTSTAAAPVDLDVRAMVGRAAALRLPRNESPLLGGVITAVSNRVVEQTQEVVIELASRLWRASRSRRSRIFVDQSLPEIIRAVMAENGLVDDFEVRCGRAFAKRPHVAQYEETDLDFLHRLCERDGVLYLEHVDAAGRAGIFFYDLVPRIAGHDVPVEAEYIAAFSEVTERAELVPRAVKVRDYAPGVPRVVQNPQDAPVLADRWTIAESGLQSFYGAHVSSPAEATRDAQLRAGALLNDHYTLRCTTLLPEIAAGRAFTIAAHRLSSLDGSYYAVSVTHRFRSALGLSAEAAKSVPSYTNEVRARRSGDPWVPPRVTPRPQMPALIPAIVHGPADHGESPLDGVGHYRLLFPYDTGAGAFPQPSGPIPLATDFGGTGFGEHHPLHRGTHVLVGHLHDDPDRPVIVRAFMPSPLVHPTTQGVAVTRSGITIEYEDNGPAWSPTTADARRTSVKKS